MMARLRSLSMPAGSWPVRIPGQIGGLRMPRTPPMPARLRALGLRQRIALALAIVAVPLGGWMILRDSALFSVDQVTVVGLSPTADGRVLEALDRAARAQTTTDFSVAAVRSAVAPYSLIQGLRVATEVPHGVRIIVRERHAIARLDVDHHLFGLAADGTVISGLRELGSGAIVRSSSYPHAGATRDPFALLALTLLRDAPTALRHRVSSVATPGGNLTFYLRGGPRLIFGNAALPHAKWLAAAAVLADPGSRGAVYIDLRVPSRPAAQVGGAQASAAAAGAPSDATSVSTLLDPALIAP